MLNNRRVNRCQSKRPAATARRGASRLSMVLLVLVGLAAFGFYGRSRQASQAQNKAAMERLMAANRAALAKAAAEIESESANPGNTEMLATQIANLDQAAKDSTGGQATLLKAGADVFRTLLPASKEYGDAYMRCEKAGVFDIGTLKKKEQIQERLDAVEVFRAANARLGTEMSGLADAVDKLLRERGASDREREQFVSGFIGSFNFAQLGAIRAEDTNLCDAMAKMIRVLEREWGKWTCGADGVVTFESDPAVAEYQKALDDLQASADRQLELQKKLIAAQQRRMP